MGRRRGLEGSVREFPPGSGQWRIRLPQRIDPRRKYLPGTYPNEALERRALAEAIVDADRGVKKPVPAARPQGRARVRRMGDAVADYTAARAADAADPISTNTIRDYKELLKNVLSLPDANLAHVPVDLVDSPTLDQWIKMMRAAGISEARVKKSFALVRATLAWEVREGRLTSNPAREVRRVTTKAGRGRRVSADAVLLPSWKEVATLAAHPERLEDRVLILALAWAGLRWSEAVGLSVKDIWPTQPRISVHRVFTWDQEAHEWKTEYVKGGNADVIPIPTRLWKALSDLAATRDVTDALGGDLLFRPTRLGHGRKPTVTIDHSDWSRRVWYPARSAAGLSGNPDLPVLDPRRRALHIKDLRAYTASVVVDSGGTTYEAASLLRHADVQTTNRYYARAQSEKSQDPARAALRVNHQLSLPERLDALWEAWQRTHAAEVAAVFRPQEPRSGTP